MDAFRVVIDASEFQSGLIVGLCCSFVACFFAIAWRIARRRVREVHVAGVAGVAFAAGSLIALDGVGPLDRVVSTPFTLVLALTGFFIAGMVSTLACKSLGAALAVNGVLAAPAAWLLAERSDVPAPGWLRATVLVAAVVIAPLSARADRQLAAGEGRTFSAGPLLLLVSVGGLYATVPDTEQVLVLLGVAVPVALMGLVPRFVDLGAGGANAAVAMMLWAAAQGAVGRPAVIVGVIGTFGLFVTLPIGRLIPGRPLPRLGKPGGAAALALLTIAQVGLALYAAQIVGPEPDVATAVLLAVPGALAALALGWLLAPLTMAQARQVRPPGPQAGTGLRPRSRS